MYSFSQVGPLTSRDGAGNQAFAWKNSHGRTSGIGLASSERTYMSKRLAIYTSAFVFLLSSVAFACPDFYKFSALIRPSSVMGGMMNHDPCRNMDDNAPQSPCYRALHDRLLSPATISRPLGDPGAMLAAADNSVLGVPLLFAQLPAWRSKSPPKLALTVRFPVLRI